jgi:hypothetical protein
LLNSCRLIFTGFSNGLRRGKAMAANMPIIKTATNNPIRVKAFLLKNT